MFKKKITEEVKNLILKQYKELKILRIKIKELEEEIEEIKEESEEILDENEENLKIMKYLDEVHEEKKLIIKENEDTIEKIHTEIKKLKEQNIKFEEILRKNPFWYINIDIAWKINPKTKKQEQFKIPKDFQIKNVYNLELSDDLKWISFKYDDDTIKDKVFKIPRPLGEQIDIVDKIENNNQEKIIIKKIKNFKDIIKIIKSKKIIFDIDHWKSSIDCICFYRGMEFTTKDFVDYCNFKNRETPRQILNKFIDFGLIKRVRKGVYKVLFNY